jgi:hypothetical protein
LLCVVVARARASASSFASAVLGFQDIGSA